MVMLLRMLSLLHPVRVSVGYASALVAVATTLVILGPRVQDAVVDHMSTNLHNLVHGHIATLLGSAFVTAGGPIYVWLPGLFSLLALAELLWRSRGLVLTFTLGHIGATLIVAAGLASAIWLGWLPVSVAHASDVGISYGAVAIVGALVAAMPTGWRPAWIGWWLGVGLVVVVVGHDFTDIGHMIALVLGILVSRRFRATPRWTLLRLGLLIVGVSFGYLVLASSMPSLVIAPTVGLVCGAAAQFATTFWRGRRLGRSQPVFDNPVPQPAPQG